MNFWASLEYAVGVMIGSCSVIGVVGAKYRNHYAQIVMVGISDIGLLRRTTSVHHSLTFGMKYACEKLLMISLSNRVHTVSGLYPGL